LPQSWKSTPVPIQARVRDGEGRTCAHHLRGVFEQATAPGMMIIPCRGRALEFLAIFREIGLAEEPQARLGDGGDHGGNIVPIAFERGAAFGRAGEELGDLLLLQPAHAYAIDVEPILIAEERTVEPNTIAVLNIVK
jgi:hypothetical protein